ncbi:MAG: pilus assembly protein N-terminal domain-containing protein [Pseudomonadota bacterium]|nr:pilus assembly protein N-terminal domain-containing protein [Pseudomonadota bacterium]
MNKTIKTISILILALLTWCNALLAADFGAIDFEILEGEVKTIEANNIERLAVGDGKLVQVQLLDNGHILLIGQAAGSTSLRTWKKNGTEQSYRIIVKSKSIHEDIQMRPTINMKVRIIEFRESSLKQIGINWDKNTAGPSFFVAKDFISTPSSSVVQNIAGDSLNMVGSSQTPLFLGSTIALSSTISFMQTIGHATTLAEPMLSCLSGQDASFLAGGQVPFSSVDTNGQAFINFKDYGIKLNIQPVADRHKRISTRISTEVSQIDGSVSVNGVPGFITRSTNTHMNVLDGQTIVISGLMQNNTREDIDYIPGLANLPIIGEMFKHKNFSEEKTQLVIFVTPTIMTPESLDQYQQREEIQTQEELQKWHSMLDSGMAEISINTRG